MVDVAPEFPPGVEELLEKCREKTLKLAAIEEAMKSSPPRNDPFHLGGREEDYNLTLESVRRQVLALQNLMTI